MDDLDLIKAIRQGDKTALIKVFEQYAPLIFRYALRLVGDVDVADDVVGDTFSEFIKQLERNKGPRENVRAYLYQIAYHKIVDNARHAKRIVELNDTTAPLQADANLDEDQESNAKLKAILDAMRVYLNDDQRHVVTLRLIEGFSLEETANVLNKSANNIKVIQNRAINKLRDTLNEQFA